MPVPTNKTLEKLLDYSVLKQKVLSQNIANVGTAGYKRKNVQFDTILQNEMQSNIKTTSNKHIRVDSEGNMKTSEFQITSDNSDENISGFNNVDINSEMAEMAENQILFKFASQKLSRYFKTLQSVIKGDM